MSEAPAADSATPEASASAVSVTSPAAAEQPTKRNSRHRRALGRSLFEMLLVVISVLLALTLDNWREDREKAALTQSVLAALAQEIDANRGAINAALDYQDRMAIAFREAYEVFEKSGEFRFPDDARNRSAAVRFSRAAYDSAVIAQVLPRIGIDTVLKLSALYAEQSAYDDLLRTYASATIQTDFANGSRYLRLRSNQYAELADVERRMLPLLEAAQVAVARERTTGAAPAPAPAATGSASGR